MNQKLKSENYQNFGGMNNKISQYDNTVFEFINIINMDFQTPGALTQRWGSTQYTTQAFGEPIASISEFSRLNGASYIMVGTLGNTFLSDAGVWAGATTGIFQGLSLTNLAVPIVLSSPGLEYIGSGTTSGLHFITSQIGRVYYQGDPNSEFYFSLGATFGNGFGGWTVSISAQGWNLGNVDERVFVDHDFIANNSAFVRFNGVTTYALGPIPPTVAAIGATVNNAAAGTTVGFFANSATAVSFSLFASYVNNRGFESQIWPIFYFSSVDLANNTVGMSAGLVGGSFIQIWADMYTPQAFGITAVNVYCYASPTLITAQTSQNLWAPAYALLGTYPVTGATTRVPLGALASTGFTNMLQNIGTQPNSVVNEYITQGITFIPLGQVQQININNFFPNILEVHKDSLFQAGFSALPSTVVFSDPVEPEGIRVDSNFEVRTNDGDIITAMKSYQGRLVVGKRNSLHVLLGDGAINFDLVEISSIFGILNKHCVVIFNDQMLFLDRKGVIEFNGAQAVPFSNKMQPTFDRMNYAAAINTACMVHDKRRNQVLIGIPIDGATTNNVTVIYDYVSNAWATQNSFNPTVFATALGYNTTKNVLYGTPSGIVNWFGPSFLADNGAGFTTYIQPRFLSDMGNSIEKQFRRLYVDATPNGSTYVLPINFFQDHGTSKVLQTTMVLSQFQNRIDFGIPAKSLSFELSNFQTQSVFQLNGFTVESRLQRRV